MPDLRTPVCELLGFDLPRTPFIDEWAGEDPEGGAAALVEAVRGGRGHELVPFAGQTAGLIGSVEPVATIIARMVEEAGLVGPSLFEDGARG